MEMLIYRLSYFVSRPSMYKPQELRIAFVVSGV